MILRPTVLAALFAAGTSAWCDAPERAYIRAGTDTLIRACMRDGHTLTLLARPGVEVAQGERLPPGLPVEAFMQGLSALVKAQSGSLDQSDLLRPGSEGTRRLSDAAEAWITAFNRAHGTRLAWAISDFGVSDTLRSECASGAAAEAAR